MNEKWHLKNNNKKGYLKIHVAVNVKTKKILSMMQVTDDEYVHDSKALPGLVDEAIKSDSIATSTIGKLFADGAYDNMIFLGICKTLGSCLVLK